MTGVARSISCPRGRSVSVRSTPSRPRWPVHASSRKILPILPALTALWTLRHIGRLFVTNFERSGDATMRQKMATTFLALTEEGSEKITSEERLMVLEALFRAPAPSKGDYGHFGGALEILMRRKPKD